MLQLLESAKLISSIKPKLCDLNIIIIFIFHLFLLGSNGRFTSHLKVKAKDTR